MRTLYGLFLGALMGALAALPYVLNASSEAEAELELTTGSVVITVRPHVDAKELECLAKNIYFEARGESYMGQAMIAHVTLTRVRANKKFWGGNTICGVVYHPKMFSWTSRKDQRMHDAVAQQVAFFIARFVLDGKFTPPDGLLDADHYFNPEDADESNVCSFRSGLVQLASVERHEYYRSPRNDLDRYFIAGQALPKGCTKQFVQR